MDFKQIHSPDHALHGHEDVLKDQFNKSTLVFVRVSGTVDNTHLFNERRLARLSRALNEFNEYSLSNFKRFIKMLGLTEQEKFELPPGIPLVLLELPLDLRVDPLLLLLLLRQAARHGEPGAEQSQGNLQRPRNGLGMASAASEVAETSSGDSSESSTASEELLARGRSGSAAPAQADSAAGAGQQQQGGDGEAVASGVLSGFCCLFGASFRVS